MNSPKPKKTFKYWRQVSALFVIAMSVSAAALFAPSNHPANAFFGLGDITLIDIQNFSEDLLESFAETLTEGIVKQLASKAINDTVSQYHIGSYLQYANNLKNQVFVAQALSNDKVAGQNQMNSYIVKSIIGDIDTNPISKVNIDPLFQKAALDVVNIQDTKSVTIGSSTQNFLATSGSFAANPGGQYFLFADLSQKVNARAQAAAERDISTANGNKSTFDCNQAGFSTGNALTADNGLGLSDAFEEGSDNGDTTGKGSESATNSQQASCLLQNPGNYVGSVLSGNIQGLFSRAFNPPQNHLSAIAGAIGSAFANIAQQQLIGGANGGTLISSTIPVNQPVPTTSTTSSSGNSTGTFTTGGGTCGLLCAPTSINLGGTDPSTGLPTSFTPTPGCNPVCPGSGTSTSSGSGSSSGSSSGGSSGSSGCSIVVLSCGVQGAETSSFGRLYALDASGNVIAGSHSSVSVPVSKKSTITIEWNAAELTGAHYVAFAPCASAQCSGSKDKKDLDGSFTAKATTGAVQTYTLQVWGVDENGTMTVLETDTIAIKTK